MEIRMPGTNPTLETRHDSYMDILSDRNRRYTQIIELFRENPEMTAKECAYAMYQKGYSSTSERNVAAPRLNELSKMGLIEPHGKKTCAWTGKSVTVFKWIKENDEKGGNKNE